MFIVVDQAKAQTPTISLIQGISFGSNVTGAATIAYNNPSAAAFAVQFPNYTGSPAVSFAFTLPAYLTDAYGDQLPISFGANSAAYHANLNSTNGATTFNPGSGVNGPLGSSSHIDYFWLGGTVTPGTNYTAASYSGAITVVVTVTAGTQQYTASEVVTVTATTTGTISLSATGALNFGQIIAGTTPPSLSALASGAPEFTVTAPARSTITAEYSLTSSLNDGYGHKLTFTPSLYGNASNTQAGSAAFLSGNSVTLGRRATHYYFWLGGNLGSVVSGQPAGTYSGIFSIRVSY